MSYFPASATFPSALRFEESSKLRTAKLFAAAAAEPFHQPNPKLAALPVNTWVRVADKQPAPDVHLLSSTTSTDLTLGGGIPCSEEKQLLSCPVRGRRRQSINDDRLTLQRYLRAEALLEGGDANAEAAETAEGAFAVGYGGTAGGGLPVGYLGGDFAQPSAAFSSGLGRVKLRFAFHSPGGRTAAPRFVEDGEWGLLPLVTIDPTVNTLPSCVQQPSHAGDRSARGCLQQSQRPTKHMSVVGGS